MVKKQAVKNLLLLVLALTCAADCSPGTKKPQRFDSPKDIRARALDFAQLYAESDTEYLWGGQDPLRSIKIDCSGLVVMCYKYALVDTGFELPFDDATAAAMHDSYAHATTDPQPGDLIFMGSAEETEISHVAIFIENIDGVIYFIDSTVKDAEGDYPSVNGVSERNYPEGDQRFKSFGILQIMNSR